MTGVPFSDPSFVCDDNKSVLFNITLPELMLKKKLTLSRTTPSGKELRLVSESPDIRH